jgi:hypothetical protein
MASRRWVVLAVLAVLLICLAGYDRVHAQTSVTITLNYNSSTQACTQTSSDGQSGVIAVAQGSMVTYQSQTAVNQFTVAVSGSACPFNSCPVSSPNGSPKSVSATGAVGSYTYSSVGLGSNQCNNPGQLGLRIH